jgi:hypothetical protein
MDPDPPLTKSLRAERDVSLASVDMIEPQHMSQSG